MRFPTRITAKNPLWAKTAKAYDFVGFDPRGVGHSAPISCVDPQEFVKAPKADPVPDSEADKHAQRKLAPVSTPRGAANAAVRCCRTLTTPNTARDLDVIRDRAREKKLNFLGVSYGTYLGAVCGTLFPTHVRRMVVDSVIDPSRKNIWYRANLNQDIAFQTRWDDWKAWVAKHDDVYGIGDTPQKVEKAWLELRAAAKKEPIGVSSDPPSSSASSRAPRTTTPPGPPPPRRGAPTGPVTQALIDAAAPDMSDLAGNAASENGNAVYSAVECADAKWPADWRTWEQGQHPAPREVPVHDVGQRLDEPALRHLARQAADPAGREDPQGPAAGPHRAVHP